MKFVFMVLLLLVCSGISAALFTKYFDNVAIGHLLEIVLFNRSLCLWNSKSLSISNVSKARNFKNHERIASLSYGSIIIESMKSFDPFDSSHIERFFQNFPEPSISDYKVFLVKYSRAHPSFNIQQIVGYHGELLNIVKNVQNSSLSIDEFSLPSGIFEQLRMTYSQ
jgi:hypothetical protein